MAKAREKGVDPPFNRKIRPSMDSEVRQSQLIALAIDRAEQRLLDGTATSQEIVHFLRLGAEKKKAELEMKKLEHETKLLQAKTENINAEKESAKMFAEAIAAMTSYRMPTEEEEDI